MTEPAPNGAGDPARPVSRTEPNAGQSADVGSAPFGDAHAADPAGPGGAEWDAALDHALDEFDRADAAENRAAGLNGAGDGSTDQHGRSRARLRSAVTTMTSRMMSERAVRASEAAAAAATASAKAAEAAAAGQTGPKEPPRRSAFHWGFFGGFGVLIAYITYLVLDTIRDTLILIAIAMLLAIGLDPLVNLITKRGMRRGSGVAIVFVGLLVVIGAAIYAIIPPIVNEVGTFASSVPQLVTELQNNSSIRDLDTKFGILNAIQNSNIVQTLGSGAASGLLTATATVASVALDLLIILVLTLYLLSGFPKIKAAAYRLVPASNRRRVTDLGDKVLKKMGGYLSGATLIAIQAGLVAGIFAAVIGLPYPWAIGLAAAVLDFIPVVGPITVGIGMTLIGFTQGVAIGIIAGIFYLLQHMFEAYWLYPRVMRRTVDISTGAVVVAILIGAALLGVTGAILAVPVAAAIMLIVREVIMPMQEGS